MYCSQNRKIRLWLQTTEFCPKYTSRRLRDGVTIVPSHVEALIYQAQVKHKITEFYHFLYKNSDCVCLSLPLVLKKQQGKACPDFCRLSQLVQGFKETLFPTNCCLVLLTACTSSWSLSSGFASSERNLLHGLRGCLVMEHVGSRVEREVSFKSALLIQTKMLIQTHAYAQRRWRLSVL